MINFKNENGDNVKISKIACEVEVDLSNAKIKTEKEKYKFKLEIDDNNNFKITEIDDCENEAVFNLCCKYIENEIYDILI